jgi:hypothetical protein
MAFDVAIAVRGSGNAAVGISPRSSTIHQICSINGGTDMSNWPHFHIALREIEKMWIFHHPSKNSSSAKENQNRPPTTTRVGWRRWSFSNEGGFGDGEKRTSVLGVD